MERLIDADKFLQDMADLYRQAGWDEREVHFSLADLRSNISMEDTILIPQREPDTAPVRHGKWINRWSGCGSVWLEQSCSECGLTFEDEPHEYKYCPNCGARMDCEDERL